MSNARAVVEGVVQPDGSLKLSKKVDLPPGRVQVMIESFPELPKDDPFWQMIQGIWNARNAAGLAPRTADEVEQERRALRTDIDRELEDAARLHDGS